MKPEYRAAGDDHLVLWREQGVGLEFSRVRETDASVTAIVRALAIGGEHKGRLLFAPTRVNLWEMAGRKRLAEAILASAPPGLTLQDWQLGIEYAYRDVLEAVSTLPEPIVLADVPIRDAGGYALAPILMLRQVNILYADGKSGKSYNALLWSVAVAEGIDLLPGGLKVLLRGPVLYLDFETDPEMQRRRLERVAAGLGLPRLPRNLHYRNLRGRTLADSAAHIRRWIDKLGVVLVVVDSLTFAAGGDLNKTEIAAPAVAALQSFPVTVCTIAHHGKAGRSDASAASVFGSAVFEFGARSLWLIKRVSAPNRPYIDTVWTNRAVNDGPQAEPFALRMHFSPANDRVSWEARDIEADEALARAGGTHEQRLLAALAQCDGGRCENAELAKLAGVDVQVARITLNRSDFVARQANSPLTWQLLGRTRVTHEGSNGTHSYRRTSEQPLKKKDCSLGVSDDTPPSEANSEHERSEHVRFVESGVDDDPPF